MKSADLHGGGAIGLDRIRRAYGDRGEFGRNAPSWSLPHPPGIVRSEDGVVTADVGGFGARTGVGVVVLALYFVDGCRVGCEDFRGR